MMVILMTKITKKHLSFGDKWPILGTITMNTSSDHTDFTAPNDDIIDVTKYI